MGASPVAKAFRIPPQKPFPTPKTKATAARDQDPFTALSNENAIPINSMDGIAAAFRPYLSMIWPVRMLGFNNLVLYKS